MSAEEDRQALEEIEQALGGFLREVENHESGRKGMQVPYHGFLAGSVGKLPPAAMSDLRHMHRFVCLTLGKPTT